MKKILSMTLILMLLMNLAVYAEGESDSILSSSYGSTFVIKDDGSLWGWGVGYTGVGNGDDPVKTPVKVMENVRSVSANTRTTIAVKKDDTLWGWGRFTGYLNNEQNPTFLMPVQILSDVKQAANGDNYILALKKDNTLWLCGDMVIGDGSNTSANTDSGFVKVMSDVKSMSAGEGTVFVIKSDDTLWGWGDNSEAQLGNMTDTGDTSTDQELTPTHILDDVKFVSNSGSVVIAVRLDNSLYNWGKEGVYTENGWVDDAGSPYKVMDNVTMGTMCNNGSGVLIVKTDGTLWGWDNQWYNEGDRQEPYKYADNVTSVSNGERHAAIVKSDGTLWTMGGNYRYGLGYESDETWYTPMTQVLEHVQDAPASWAAEIVEKAIGAQLIPENMQGNYTKIITREEFCILAIRMIELKSNMPIEDYIKARGLELKSTSPFVDCDNEDVIAASTLNIVKGMSPTTFEPDNQLTREQAAVVLSTTARAIGEEITATTPAYADASKIADWAKPFIGYVYNSDVMKGVGGNRFDPKGGYQRQQAYITMFKLFNAINKVSMAKMEVSKTETAQTKVSATMDESNITLTDLKKEIASLTSSSEFHYDIEGTTKSPQFSAALKYKGDYKAGDARVDTYWDDLNIATAIYDHVKDITYTEYKRGTHFAETVSGNTLPIGRLDVKFLERLEIDTEVELFTAHYEMLNGEKVLYIKTDMKNGVVTEKWYSLKYLIPLKFHEIINDQDGISEINWHVVNVDESTIQDDMIFDIPEDAVQTSVNSYDNIPVTGNTRDLLLYEVSFIDVEEKGFDDMTQIFYYSDASYENLVDYFENLLKGTEEYSLFAGDKQTSLDGTLNDKSVIVIVNNYMKYEPEVGKNGINLNY